MLEVIFLVISVIVRFKFDLMNQVLIEMEWWRRRESNPRPQALRLRLYMLSRVYWGLADPAPDGQGSGPASPWVLVIQVGAAFTTIS